MSILDCHGGSLHEIGLTSLIFEGGDFSERKKSDGDDNLKTGKLRKISFSDWKCRQRRWK